MIDQKEEQKRLEQVWYDDWRHRHIEKVLATGATSIADFLSQHPAIPYDKVVRKLNRLVAPIQLQQLQFDEAAKSGSIRDAAMDLLVRTLNGDLKRGWQKGGHWRSNQAAAYAHFTLEVPKFAAKPELQMLAERVWKALAELSPPMEWIPKSTDAPLIEKAFNIGWPKGTS